MSKRRKIKEIEYEEADEERYFLNPDSVSCHLFCSICQDVFSDPQRAPCGHSYCKKCILPWLKHNRTCPEDRKSVTVNQLHHDFILENIIGDQMVACPYRKTGCDFIGQLQNLSNHKKRCDFNPVNLPEFILETESPSDGPSAEEFTTRISILCLTETHATDASAINADVHPDYVLISKDTTHGLAMLNHENFCVTQLPYLSTLEMLVSVVKCNTCTNYQTDVLIVLIYRPPGPQMDFLQQLDSQLSELPMKDMPVIVTGDFNMPNHDRLDDLLLTKYELAQVISGPTHRQGGQLDLLFTNVQLQIPTIPVPVFFSDHFLVWIVMDHQHKQ